MTLVLLGRRLLALDAIHRLHFVTNLLRIVAPVGIGGTKELPKELVVGATVLLEQINQLGGRCVGPVSAVRAGSMPLLLLNGNSGGH